MKRRWRIRLVAAAGALVATSTPWVDAPIAASPAAAASFAAGDLCSAMQRLGASTASQTLRLQPSSGASSQDPTLVDNDLGFSVIELSPQGRYTFDDDLASEWNQTCMVNLLPKLEHPRNRDVKVFQPLRKVVVHTPGAAAADRAVITGQLSCGGCNGWVFDRVIVVGGGMQSRRGGADGTFDDPPGYSGPPIAEGSANQFNSQYVIKMSDGTGWTWSNCDVSNPRNDATDSSATAQIDQLGYFGTRGVLNGASNRNWTIEHCDIHDNGESYQGSPRNHDHLIYFFGDFEKTPEYGLLRRNRFFNNGSGAAVKLGYGLVGRDSGFLNSVQFVENQIFDSFSADQSCGVMLPFAFNVYVLSNEIDCGLKTASYSDYAPNPNKPGTFLPVDPQRIAVNLAAARADVSGASIWNNTFRGTSLAGQLTGCPTFGSGDMAIMGKSALLPWLYFRLNPRYCTMSRYSNLGAYTVRNNSSLPAPTAVEDPTWWGTDTPMVRCDSLPSGWPNGVDPDPTAGECDSTPTP